MLRNILTLTLVLTLFCPYCLSEYSTYNTDYQNSEYSEEYNNKVGFWDRVKNAFIGQATGYTPQIVVPSPYINTYGPSYMRGYYGTNGWNSHNSFNPVYTGSRIRILD